ncbi:MAG TPA: HEPN domain-containing protein [bacterium]|nr:HEPN domain-containing protein [bacterium]
MFDVEKQTAYWKSGAEEDWEVACDLISRGKARYGLFFAHLALEKALKAHVSRVTLSVPPKTHTLLRLSELAGLALDSDRREFLAVFDRYQLEGRYPEMMEPPPGCDRNRTCQKTGRGDAAMVDAGVVAVVRRYVEAVRSRGIAVDRVMVFGSCARGESTIESDIDLLIVSRDFNAPRQRKRSDILWRLRAETDARIEPIAAGTDQWLHDDGDPLLAIARKEGVEIPLPA